MKANYNKASASKFELWYSSSKLLQLPIRWKFWRIENHWRKTKIIGRVKCSKTKLGYSIRGRSFILRRHVRHWCCKWSSLWWDEWTVCFHGYL